MDRMSDKDQYFATQNTTEICGDLMRKVEDYFQYLTTSGRLTIWRRSYEYYYRGIFRGGRMARQGSENEYTTICVNHYRNLLQHLLNMTTQQLPALLPRASNTDFKSMAQTITATGILDYYLNEKGMQDYSKTAVEHALVFGEGFVECDWDVNAGEDYAADNMTQKVIKTGDIHIANYTPLDAVKDFNQPAAGLDDWIILRSYKNKYDLAAKYPQYRDEIINTSIDQNRPRDQRFGQFFVRHSDLIPVFKFYHKKCTVVPNGRIVEFISSDTALFDGPMPYEEVPVLRMSPNEQTGTPFGYTIGFDLLPLQEALDGLYSTIVTNQANYGVQNIAMPTGSNIGVQSLAGGLNLITYDPKAGKPEGINLTNTPPEIFKFLDMLEHVCETISGVNSVARGNPEASLKSGAALALVQSMAIQFNSGLQQSYAKLWSDLGTTVIKHLKMFPQTKRLIAISGKDNRSYMAEFSKDDIAQIERVTVELGNPLSKTTAGKVDMAQNLLQSGLITEPDQYIQVLTTGNLEPIYKGKQAELMLVKSENEKLIEGQTVQAVATDTHALHIHEHKTVIASPESRENPQVVQNTLGHIQEHIGLLRTVDPNLLMILGQQPIAPPPAPQPQPPSNQPGNQPAGMPPILNAENPMTQQAQNIKMPSMPKNALTGRTYNPITGGM